MRMVAADNDQLGAELIGLLEDELRQLLTEPERLGNRLFLEHRRGGDDSLPHVDHEHLGVECPRQPGDDRQDLSRVIRAADGYDNFREHDAAILYDRRHRWQAASSTTGRSSRSDEASGSRT